MYFSCPFCRSPSKELECNVFNLSVNFYSTLVSTLRRPSGTMWVWLYYVGVAIFYNRCYKLCHVTAYLGILVILVYILQFLIAIYHMSSPSLPVATGAQPMIGLMPSTLTCTTVHPLDAGFVKKYFSVILADYASMYWSHLRPRWVWSSGCGHCYECVLSSYGTCLQN